MRSFGFALLVLAFSCSTPSAPTADEPRAAFQETSAPVSGPSCNDDTFCTREYLPTSCQFKGQKFDGSNPCEAKRLVRRYACENSVPFLDTAVSCQPKSAVNTAAAADTGAAKNCQATGFCTKEMNPHSCVFGGEKFQGNNRCEAVQKAKAYACVRGLALDEKALVCQPTRKENAG